MDTHINSKIQVFFCDTFNSRNSDSVATSPAVTTKGFWLLTHAVEIEIEQSDNISGIYNSPNCTDAIKGAIIK